MTFVRKKRNSTLEEDFEYRTIWQDGCRVWVGPKNPDGYGYLKAGVAVHRYSYEREHGPIPKGLVIDHRCHVRSCCNVEHLRAVTQAQNVQNPRGPQKDNTTGYLNVFWDPHRKSWRVRVKHNGRSYYGGSYSDVLDANLAAIALRKKLRPDNQTL